MVNSSDGKAVPHNERCSVLTELAPKRVERPIGRSSRTLEGKTQKLQHWKWGPHPPQVHCPSSHALWMGFPSRWSRIDPKSYQTWCLQRQSQQPELIGTHIWSVQRTTNQAQASQRTWPQNPNLRLGCARVQQLPPGEVPGRSRQQCSSSEPKSTDQTAQMIKFTLIFATPPLILLDISEIATSANWPMKNQKKVKKKAAPQVSESSKSM